MLLTDFRAIGEKIIIILDYAANYHGMEVAWKSPVRTTKTECVPLISDLGIGAIGVSHNGEYMIFNAPCREGTFANTSKGSTILEVQQALWHSYRSAQNVVQAERCGIHFLLARPYSPDF